MQVLYNGSKQDEYLTPAYAVEIICKYLKPHSTILCPFDTKESNFVKILTEQGHTVFYSHLQEKAVSHDNFIIPELRALKNDFFNYSKQDLWILGIDYIISNPPFSLKTAVIEHLEQLEIPFAMLMPIAQMLETKKRQEIYKRIDLQILHPNKRIKFIDGITGEIKGTPTFTTGYLCRNILPKNLVFDDFIDK